MRTDQLERLLTEALHEGDALPVDTAAAERRLAYREVQRVPAARRWSVALVAATLVGVLVAVSLVLGGRLDDAERADPVGPAPRSGLAPSGLPIGVLHTRVDLTNSWDPGPNDLRLLIRADGSGQYKLWDFDSSGADDSVDAFDVTLRGAGPGRATVAYAGSACLTLTFVVAPDRVTWTAAEAAGGCFASPAVATALVGTVAAVEPLPATGSLG